MIEEKRDMDIEGLFRNKLEENEMEAGADLTGRVMRRLERKEFLRFNPSRFNIFYAAAAAAVDFDEIGKAVKCPHHRIMALRTAKERR